jgi:hypothetical protein
MPKELEQLDREELELLLASIESNTPKMSSLLFPHCPYSQVTVLQQICEWAVNRKAVLDSRAEGNPHIALVFDKICYRIWQQLPRYAKDIKIEIDPDTWQDRRHDGSIPAAGST